MVEVLPGWMWGPGDAAPTAAGQVVIDFLKQKLPVIPEGGTSTVDARDVACAMLACAQRAPHGERYIVGGDFRTLEQTLAELEQLTRVRGPRRRVPFVLALVFAWFEETRSRLTGSPLLVSREALKLMRECYAVSSAKAQRELGVTFRPFSLTLADTVAWYREHGFVEGDSELSLGGHVEALPGDLAEKRREMGASRVHRPAAPALNETSD